MRVGGGGRPLNEESIDSMTSFGDKCPAFVPLMPWRPVPGPHLHRDSLRRGGVRIPVGALGFVRKYN